MFDVVFDNDYGTERGKKKVLNYNVYLNGNKIGGISGISKCISYLGRGNSDATRDGYKYDVDTLEWTYHIFGYIASREKHSTLAACRYALIQDFKTNEYKPDDIEPEKETKYSDVKLLTDGENKDFYPTPSKLAGLMFTGIDWKNVDTVLEPSAGKADLIEALNVYMKANYIYRENVDIDCIEKDKNLQYILTGKGYKVIYDDFIKFSSNKKYDLIIMNPPFSEGAKHLIQAINIQKNGGQICCLLNAETLINPYNNERKILIQMLQKYNAKIKYIKNAFKHSERKTNVKVAIVWLNIPSVYGSSKILEGIEKAQSVKEENIDITEISRGGFIENYISQFNKECELCTEFIREYRAIKPYIMSSYDEKTYDYPIIELKICGDTNKGLNDCLKAIRSKYWRKLFTNKELMSKFTSDLRNNFKSMVEDMRDYDFNEFNIKKIIARMNSELIGGIETEIYKIFNKLSSDYSYYPECKNNIHYYNGWKTNKAHKVGMKVIIPSYGVFSTYSWDSDTFKVREAYDKLADIEKCLNYLDGHSTESVDLRRMLELANNNGITKNIKCKYFGVTFYKKGTCHIKFHPEFEYLIDALNIFVGKNKKWLPPHYGKASYEEMTDEEKAIVDEFQGKESYQKVFNNPQTYLYEVNGNPNLLSISAS